MQPIDDSTPLSAEDINAMSNLSLGSPGSLGDRIAVQRPVMPARRFNDFQAPAPAPAPARAPEPAATPAPVASAAAPLMPAAAPVAVAAQVPAPVQTPIPAPAAAPATAASPMLMPDPKPARRRFAKVSLAKLAISSVAVALVVTVFGVGSYASTLKARNAELTAQMAAVAVDPERTADRQTVTMIAKAGQLMPLPKDEKPVVTTIDNVAKVRAQSTFFANAEKGDVVMLYAKNSQAVLYRPLTNKIVMAAQLNFTQPLVSAPATPAVR